MVGCESIVLRRLLLVLCAAAFVTAVLPTRSSFSKTVAVVGDKRGRMQTALMCQCWGFFQILDQL